MNAGRKMWKGVADTASATQLAVDDLNRHTVDRLVTTVKSKIRRSLNYSRRLLQCMRG